MVENDPAVKLASEIKELLVELESTFYDVFVHPEYVHGVEYESSYYNSRVEDKKTWLYFGTRTLYYKICLFLEVKKVPLYLKMFTNKFEEIIDNQEEVTDSRPPLYSESEPSMIIHDDFREFLSAFSEFDYTGIKTSEKNKLKLILENTNSILSKTNAEITNETSIYTPIKWFIDIIYPTARLKNKSRFISKFKTYHPDILIPEVSSAVEYKYIRKGVNPENYIDQIKTDADNYVGDPQYKYFYAVVVFEDSTEINPASFKQLVLEKKFPSNWLLMAL